MSESTTNTSKSPQASAEATQLEQNIRSSTQAALRSDSRRHWQERKKFIRQNWPVPFLFLLVWLTAGFFLWMRTSTEMPLNSGEWLDRHTVRATRKFSYCPPEAQTPPPPAFVGSVDFQSCIRNRTALQELRRSAFTPEAYASLTEQQQTERKALEAVINQNNNWTELVKQFDNYQHNGIRPPVVPYHFLELPAPPAVYRIRLVSNPLGNEHIYNYMSLEVPVPEQAETKIAAEFTQSIHHPELAAPLALLLTDTLQPNIVYDPQLTSAFAQEELRLRPTKEIPAGGEILKPSMDAAERYDAFRNTVISSRRSWRERLPFLRSTSFWLRFGGIGLLLYIFFRSTLKIHTHQASELKLMTLLSLFLVMEFSLVHFVMNYYYSNNASAILLMAILPLGYFPVMLSCLLDNRFAISSALLLSVLLPLQTNFCEGEFRLFYFALFVTLGALPCFMHQQRRMQFLFGGIYLGLIVALAALLFRIDANFPPGWTERIALLKSIGKYSLANGVGTGIACIITLPIFEALFRLSSLLTINELSDINTPLLQRLRTEAPGTYAHSMAVADLATNAAIAIGANAKLVNVMALYHDIGKLYAPRMFGENIPAGAAQPHEHLSPIESCNIIREHVRFGVSLAHKYHLSTLILPAIIQHHGNSRLEHFYRKAALEAAEKKLPPPKEEDFRYPFPAPVSREVAVISICDACEAAVRAMLSHKPDTNQIAQHVVAAIEPLLKEEHINPNQLTEKCSNTLAKDLTPAQNDLTKQVSERIASVINGKLIDHQLDSAMLTTKELNVIRQSILDTVIYKSHARPEYLR